VPQAVKQEHLPSKCEALSSNPKTAKKKTKKFVSHSWTIGKSSIKALASESDEVLLAAITEGPTPITSSTLNYLPKPTHPQHLILWIKSPTQESRGHNHTIIEGNMVAKAN
jgi:hypothetical protein